jgi:hypothetical protein
MGLHGPTWAYMGLHGPTSLELTDIGPGRHHDRRAADPGRAAARGQNCPGHRRADTYQITVEHGIAFAAPRKTSRDIHRHKASDYG